MIISRSTEQHLDMPPLRGGQAASTGRHCFHEAASRTFSSTVK
jgi:hypothetical protein